MSTRLETNYKGLARFQSLDEKSFVIQKTPVLVGSCDKQTWREHKQESVEENKSLGHSVMIPLAAPKSYGGLAVSWKQAFTKSSKVIRSAHFLIFQEEEKLILKAIEPVIVNSKEIPGEATVELKQNDKICFPGDTSKMPYCYHIQLPQESEEMDFNFDILKPLISKCDPRLQIFIEMVQERQAEEAGKEWWTRAEIRLFKCYLLAFGYGRWSKIRAISS